MVTNGTIPTLKRETFQKKYSIDAQSSPIADILGGDLFFNIDHRCAWPSALSPHRLDHYMIFIVTHGEGIHTLGDSEYYIRENMLCFIGPDMVRSWKAEKDEQRGFFIAFSDLFFSHGCADKNFLSELPFFQVGGTPLLNLTEDEAAEYLSIFEMMQREYRNGSQYSTAILRSQLQLLIHKANAKLKMHEQCVVIKNTAGIRLVKEFKKLFLRDLTVLGKGKSIMRKQIAEYAKALGVTQNHLNDTVKQVTGRSAGQLVRYQLTHHATSCLMHAGKNISEIAYALGFEDPAYFARFYKNQTGKSPTEFRASINP